MINLKKTNKKIKPTKSKLKNLIELKIVENFCVLIFNFTHKIVTKKINSKINEKYIEVCWKKIEKCCEAVKKLTLVGLKLKTLTNICISFCWKVCFGCYFEKRSI